MTIVVALGLFAILGFVAGLHVYWAVGGYWPAKDRAGLPKTVIGVTGDRMPPAAITLLVAGLIGTAALLPVLGVLGIGPVFWVHAGLAVLCLVFLLRGVAGYLPAFQTGLNQEPFATRNRRYYSPLCLILGLGYGVLFFQ